MEHGAGMETVEVCVGMNVKTISGLGKKHRDLCVRKRYLKARRSNKKGIVHSYVAGHGGDAWFVQHANGSIGAYMTNEFRPRPEPEAE
jgi:hypothetical protein